MSSSLDAYRESRDRLISQLVETLSSDERFVAAWLTGSLSRGDADAVSDLDLTLVVSDSHSENLCRRIEQISQKTAKERLALFSQFGAPVIVHENNYNAPEGGTFTFTLYAKSHLMIDWILIPQSKACRPPQAYLLFEKMTVPIAPLVDSESHEQWMQRASEKVAFFWMMLAITAKYVVRKDRVFVIRWLEELNAIAQEVEQLMAGKAWEYVRGSRSQFEPTIEGQKQAVLELGRRMESLLPGLMKMGAQALPSPMSDIEALLELSDDGESTSPK